MNCYDTTIFLFEWYRMCKYFSESDNEKNCPVGVGCGGCRLLAMTEPAKMISIVQKWSDARPIHTQLSVFLEKFPNATMGKKGYPVACAGNIFGHQCKYGENCSACWNTPIEDTKCSAYIDGKTPRCNGTKEIDVCSCGGDKSKCDFYKKG